MVERSTVQHPVSTLVWSSLAYRKKNKRLDNEWGDGSPMKWRKVYGEEFYRKEGYNVITLTPALLIHVKMLYSFQCTFCSTLLKLVHDPPRFEPQLIKPETRTKS